MAPKLPLALSSEVNMWEDMPNMAVEALDAFHGFTWSAVRMILKLKWPKDSKARRHDKLKKMMEEVENKTYRQDPAYSHTDSYWGDDQWAFEKHFPTWSKMRDDMEEDYHEFISEHINATV